MFGTGAGQRVKEALGRASPVDPRTPYVHVLTITSFSSSNSRRIHFKASDDVRQEENDDVDDKNASPRVNVHSL